MASPDKPSLFSRVIRFWDPIWLRTFTQRYRGRSGWGAFGVRQLEVFLLTARGIVQENIALRAAALTYRTLLSIVPLMAVAFALFKAFGGLERLEGPLRRLIVENLAVGRVGEVEQWLQRFIENINAGAIAGIGLLFLFYSAVGLLNDMERSLNEIWGVVSGRSFFIRFAIYWCLVTLTPPLVGYSISLTASLQSSAMGAAALTWLPFGLGRLVLSLTSLLATCVAFMLIYLVVPSAKVRLKAAFLGGLVAGLIWSATKYLFITFTAGSIKYSAVYGALGVLPILMIWLYLSWIIVLFGATYAFAIQTVATESLEVGAVPICQGFRELLAARLVAAVAARFKAGGPPCRADELAAEVKTLPSVARRVLSGLVHHRLLLEAASDGGAEPGFVPGQDLQELTLGHVIDVVRHKEGRSFSLGDDPVRQHLGQILQEAEAAGRAVLDQVTLSALARQTLALAGEQGCTAPAP